MPQENLENESLLVSRSPLFNLGLRHAVDEAMEMEEITDRIIDAVTSLPEERGQHMNLRYMLSVRMSLDEGLGYLGGQRLAHERPNLLVPALDQFANLSWHAIRRSHFDRGEYRQGFVMGFHDELDGTAHPLPPEQSAAFLGA